MKKTTERYDLAVFSKEEKNVKNALQKACDENEIYPIKISKCERGFIVSFLRNPDIIPQYLYSNKIMNISNKMKSELSLLTITINRKAGSIDTDKMPFEKKQIQEEAAELISEKSPSAIMLKNVEEDNAFFNSFASKQIEKSDYDTKEGRAVDKHILRIIRITKNLHTVESSVKRQLQGQLAFNLERYR